jgi:hypothetical protein
MGGWQRFEGGAEDARREQLSTQQALASSREGPKLQDKIHIARENRGERCEGEGQRAKRLLGG